MVRKPRDIYQRGYWWKPAAAWCPKCVPGSGLFDTAVSTPAGHRPIHMCRGLSAGRGHRPKTQEPHGLSA